MSVLEIDQDDIEIVGDEQPKRARRAAVATTVVQPGLPFGNVLEMRQRLSMLPGLPNAQVLAQMSDSAIMQLFLSYEDRRPRTLADLAGLAPAETLANLPTLEALARLDYSDIARLCRASPLFEYRYCGNVGAAGNEQLNEYIVTARVAQTSDMWLMLLRRDFGMSRDAAQCKHPVRFMREAVARSMRTYFPADPVRDRDAAEIQKMAAVYRELRSLRVIPVNGVAEPAYQGVNVTALTMYNGVAVLFLSDRGVNPDINRVQMLPLLDLLLPEDFVARPPPRVQALPFTNTPAKVYRRLAQLVPTREYKTSVRGVRLVAVDKDQRFGISGFNYELKPADVLLPGSDQSALLSPLIKDAFFYRDPEADDESQVYYRAHAMKQRDDAASFSTSVFGDADNYAKVVYYYSDGKMPLANARTNTTVPGLELEWVRRYVDDDSDDDGNDYYEVNRDNDRAFQNDERGASFFVNADYEFVAFLAPRADNDRLRAALLYRVALTDASNTRIANQVEQWRAAQLPGTFVTYGPSLNEVPEEFRFVQFGTVRVDEPGAPFAAAMVFHYSVPSFEVQPDDEDEEAYTPERTLFYIVWVEYNSRTGALEEKGSFKLELGAGVVDQASPTLELFGGVGAFIINVNHERDQLAVRVDLFARRFSAIVEFTGWRQRPLCHDRYLSNYLLSPDVEGALERWVR